MYLVAGLGNPGKKYKNTRHNSGFEVINLWVETLGVRLTGRRFRSKTAGTRHGDKKIILMQPDTFMNLSGESIRACVDFFKIKTENILIVHDDLDLPPGRIKVVRNGGAGGHKGILSVTQHLGTREFSRVKIGIGRPRFGEQIEDYVLSPFYSDQREVIGKVIQMGVKACELFAFRGIESAMNEINCHTDSIIEEGKS